MRSECCFDGFCMLTSYHCTTVPVLCFTISFSWYYLRSEHSYAHYDPCQSDPSSNRAIVTAAQASSNAVLPLDDTPKPKVRERLSVRVSYDLWNCLTFSTSSQLPMKIPDLSWISLWWLSASCSSVIGENCPGLRTQEQLPACGPFLS